MTPLCEQVADIRRRMEEIAREEGQPDEALLGFDGNADALASRYQLSRGMGETDDELIARVIATARTRGL